MGMDFQYLVYPFKKVNSDEYGYVSFEAEAKRT